MYPWQQDMLDNMTKFKGRGVVQITGRNTGKSQATAQAIKRLMDDLMHRPIEDLVLNEGTVYGSRYYTVEPIGGNWIEMERWCFETFGDDNPIWGDDRVPEPSQRWYKNNRKFWFRDEKDRLIFVLKWR